MPADPVGMKRSRESAPRPLAGTIDAHAHTWSTQFAEDYGETMDRAWAAGLVGVVEVGVDLATSRQALDLAGGDARIHAVAGLHPHEARRLAEQRSGLEELLGDGGFVALGEIGLDFFRDLSPRDQQREAFEWQLELAHEHDLPVVIHSRAANVEVFAVVEAWANRGGRYLGADREIGMMHCFAGDTELATRYIELGLLISVPGTVTYSGNELGQAVARSIPASAMLIETDCPYLTPAPHRGARNEPAYVVETARFVASIRGETPEAVASASAQNAGRLFGFSVDAEV